MTQFPVPVRGSGVPDLACRFSIAGRLFAIVGRFAGNGGGLDRVDDCYQFEANALALLNQLLRLPHQRADLCPCNFGHSAEGLTFCEQNGCQSRRREASRPS